MAPIGRLAGAHVKDCRSASPDDGRTGLSQLVNHDSADALGGVLHDGARKGHRCGRACQRHADDFRGNSGTRQIDEILRGELRPVQWRRRAHIKDGPRMLAEGLAASTFDREKIEQRVQTRSRKRASDDRFFGIPQH